MEEELIRNEPEKDDYIFTRIVNEVEDSLFNNGIPNIYWDIKNPLSFNCLFNFIVGNRGGGKSYGAKEYCLNNWFKKGEEFVYVRRTDTELTKSAKYFFADIIEKYPGYVGDYRRGEFLIAEDKEDKKSLLWKTVGYAINLSTASNRKSVPYPKVSTIIFDEFILTPNGRNSYLTDEVTLFLDLYETVARMRDVKVFFLSNALTVYNPYFLFFKLKVPTNKRLIGRNGDDILVQMVVNPEYVKRKKSTRFGKIIEGTDYEKYAVLNNFLLDDESLIKKKTGKLTYICTFQYKDKFWGFYCDYHTQLYYLSNNKDFNQGRVIRTVLENGKLNPLTTKNKSQLPELKMCIYSFVEGALYFETQEMKHEALEMIGRLM